MDPNGSASVSKRQKTMFNVKCRGLKSVKREALRRCEAQNVELEDCHLFFFFFSLKGVMRTRQVCAGVAGVCRCPAGGRTHASCCCRGTHEPINRTTAAFIVKGLCLDTKQDVRTADVHPLQPDQHPTDDGITEERVDVLRHLRTFKHSDSLFF